MLLPSAIALPPVASPADEVVAKIPGIHIGDGADREVGEVVSEAELEAAGVQLAEREVRIVQVRIDRGDAGLAPVGEQDQSPFFLFSPSWRPTR